MKSSRNILFSSLRLTRRAGVCVVFLFVIIDNYNIDNKVQCFHGGCPGTRDKMKRYKSNWFFIFFFNYKIKSWFVWFYFFSFWWKSISIHKSRPYLRISIHLISTLVCKIHMPRVPGLSGRISIIFWLVTQGSMSRSRAPEP